MKRLSYLFNNISFACLQYTVFSVIKIGQCIFSIKNTLHKTKKVKSNKVIILENFPIENSGYQYRAAKWAEVLNKNGFHAEVCTLFEDKIKFEKKLYSDNLSMFFIKSMIIRFRQIIYARRFETVIVRRELLLFNDYGNLFMEKFLLKAHPNVILDFDDDISAAKNQPREITNLFGKLLMENGNKFNDSLRLYKRFIVASDYLREKTRNENPKTGASNIVVVPTCVDYDIYPTKEYKRNIEKISFGWIGAPNNYPLLDTLLPVLNELSQTYTFKLIVIGGNSYKRDVGFEIEFIPWCLNTEVENLLKIDIGLMPLTDTLENRGKGGFKLIQYMGLGIVSIASALTINREIINHKYDSFLAEELFEWKETMTLILEKKIDLAYMGKNAREKILKKYSFNANKDAYVNFINNLPQNTTL